MNNKEDNKAQLMYSPQRDSLLEEISDHWSEIYEIAEKIITGEEMNSRERLLICRSLIFALGEVTICKDKNAKEIKEIEEG